MHSRIDILKNQKKYSYEIQKWFKDDLNKTITELSEIESEDQAILEAKQNLEQKSEKVKIKTETNKFIINEKNIYPKFYAWWNELDNVVEIFLYETK